MKIILILIFATYSLSLFSQEKKEIAIQNFETFFEFFQKSYSADISKYSFVNYSELEDKYAFPEELEMMIEYDTSKFYNSYLYLIKNLRDTLIDIENLKLSLEVKNLYKDFKQSVLNGEQVGFFNYEKDKLLSDSLKFLLTNILPPQIGYYQTAIRYTQLGKRKKPDAIYIQYSNNLEVISFGEIFE